MKIKKISYDEAQKQTFLITCIIINILCANLEFQLYANNCAI